MDVASVSATDRAILLQAFQRYRATDEFESDNAVTRDALEAKVRTGAGEFDEVERQMLIVSIVTTTQDNDLFYHFKALLGL